MLPNGLVDAPAHHLHVGALDHVVVGGRDHQALAHRAVGRGQLAAQLRVLDRLKMAVDNPGEQAPLPAGLDHRGAERPLEQLLGDAVGPAVQPPRAVHGGQHRARVAPVREGGDPLWCAHHVLEVLDLAAQRPHHLHAGRAGADHRDPLVGQRDRVVPARGVEAGAVEGVQTLDLRVPGMDEEAGGGDQEVHAVLLTVLGGDPPAAFLEACADDLCVDARVVGDPVLGGDALEVALDLGAGREPLRPARVGLERVLVVARRDVAPQTGIGPAPTTAILGVRPPDPFSLNRSSPW